MNATVRGWLSSSRSELDAIFRSASVAAMRGEMRGTIIVSVPALAHVVAALMSIVWKGKVFGGAGGLHEGTVVNRVTPFGIAAVAGTFRPAASWLDGKPAICMDYSRTSFIARDIRDEIREIEPGVFMGKVWWRRMRLFDFALVAST